MGRVINPDGVGKQRQRLTRSTVLALRELMTQTGTNDKTRDLAAYIALALDSIHDTIDRSVGAWEKRGYWVKADRFRMEWIWTARYSREMQQALLDENWAGVAATAAKVGEKLSDVKVPKRHGLGTPWVGAWEKLQHKETAL